MVALLALCAHADGDVTHGVLSDLDVVQTDLQSQGQGVTVGTHDPHNAVATDPEPAVSVVGDRPGPQPAVGRAGTAHDLCAEPGDLDLVAHRGDGPLGLAGPGGTPHVAGAV